MFPLCKYLYQNLGRWERTVPRSPVASPCTISLKETESGLPARECRDRPARKPCPRTCHHPGRRTAGSFDERPPRREQLFLLISASQGSKCALLQPLADSQLANSFSLSWPCSCGEKLQTCVHASTFTHALLSSLKKTIGNVCLLKKIQLFALSFST